MSVADRKSGNERPLEVSGLFRVLGKERVDLGVERGAFEPGTRIAEEKDGEMRTGGDNGMEFGDGAIDAGPLFESESGERLSEGVGERLSFFGGPRDGRTFLNLFIKGPECELIPGLERILHATEGQLTDQFGEDLLLRAHREGRIDNEEAGEIGGRNLSGA